MSYESSGDAAYALQLQYRELDLLLDRLEYACREFIPHAGTFWQGPARISYNSAVDHLTERAGAAILHVRAARDKTRAALGEVGAQ